MNKLILSVIAIASIILSATSASAKPVNIEISGDVYKQNGFKANLGQIITTQVNGYDSVSDHTNQQDNSEYFKMGNTRNSKSSSSTGMANCKAYAAKNKLKLGAITTDFTTTESKSPSKKVTIAAHTEIQLGKFQSNRSMATWSICQYGYTADFHGDSDLKGTGSLSVKNSGAFNTNRPVTQIAESFPVLIYFYVRSATIK